MEPDIFAYYMNDGFTYIGKLKLDNLEEKIIITDFIVMLTIKIAEDKRAPEIVISETYDNRNKGREIVLSSEKKVGSSNISCALRQRKKDYFSPR